MAKKTPRASKKNTKRDKEIAFLRKYIRNRGVEFLEDPNITSIGTGYKVVDGKKTDTICLQFTVGSKVGPESLDQIGTNPIPEFITYGNKKIPTDVVQRDYTAEFELVDAEQLDPRKLKADPMVPGVSVSHYLGSAGTFGMVVYDQVTGQSLLLSNWHVLNHAQGQIGDSVVQPGPHDDNNLSGNEVGKLLRSHLGPAGDCAVATMVGRDVEPEILGLGVIPERVARVEIDDIVIKSGRTTGITQGKVRRVDVMVRIDYSVGPRVIGGFEIGLLDGASSTSEISLGGDSGSVWLIRNGDGTASDILAGLHFAGEKKGNPDEHAIACYASSVFKKLGVGLRPPSSHEGLGLPDGVFREGFSEAFLAEDVPLPALSAAQKRDSFRLGRSNVLNYTHFSLNLSKKRRLSRYVAWNIDGGRIRRLSRNGISFLLDPRIPSEFQNGNELYRRNPLDRGHIARRADLCWGSMEEARRANVDSFFYTNIAPQHEAFNQSGKGGLWGRLENHLFEEVRVEDIKVSVLAGPIFSPDDPEHRGVLIPRSYWKVLAYLDLDDDQFKVRAYVLSQGGFLLSRLETLELDPFRLYQVSLGALAAETDLDFGVLEEFDVFADSSGAEPEGLPSRREIQAASELFL